MRQSLLKVKSQHGGIDNLHQSMSMIEKKTKQLKRLLHLEALSSSPDDVDQENGIQTQESYRLESENAQKVNSYYKFYGSYTSFIT